MLTHIFLGVTIIFPYLTLQMLNLGMTIADVSLVYGAIPFFTFFSSPLAGKYQCILNSSAAQQLTWVVCRLRWRPNRLQCPVGGQLDPSRNCSNQLRLDSQIQGMLPGPHRWDWSQQSNHGNDRVDVYIATRRLHICRRQCHGGVLHLVPYFWARWKLFLGPLVWLCPLWWRIIEACLSIDWRALPTL